MMGDGKPSHGDGTVYLLHLDPPLKHARHYTGWTSDLDQRLEAHRAGRGARLLEVVREAGGTFRLVRTWPGSRTLERAIKNRKEAPKLCPECSPHPLPVARGRAADTSPERRAAPAASADVVPEPDPAAWLRPWPGRPAAPDLYSDLEPLADGLISGWRAQLDSATCLPALEADPEAELLSTPQLEERARSLSIRSYRR
jgi:predicted GIY-YIG superfamily endonuclease